MTVDRYLAITSPIYHRTKVSERVVVMSITLSWLLPAVLRGVVFIPFYHVYKRKVLDYGLPILLVIFETLPCLLILFTVVRISIIARRQRLQHRKKSKERSNIKDKKKARIHGFKNGSVRCLLLYYLLFI